MSASSWVLTNGPDIAPLKRTILSEHAPETGMPLGRVLVGGEVAPGRPELGHWRRRHVAADGYVDESRFLFTPTYRLFLAATVLEVDQPEWRTLHLDSTGPVHVWVDGELVMSSDAVSYMDPVTTSVPLLLNSGTSEVVVASWQVALREVRQVLRLRIEGLPVRVVLPEDGADEFASAAAEQVLDAVGSPSWALLGHGSTVATLTGPVGARLLVRADDGPWRTVRLEDGRAEVDLADESGDEGVVSASMLATGETRLGLRLADERTPVERWVRVLSLPQDCRTEPEGDPEQWRAEVLAHVAAHPGHSAGALARQRLGTLDEVRTGDVSAALHRITTRGDCADFEVLGLMLLWHAVPAEQWQEGLREQIRQALTGMKFWIEQPGLDAMCYFTENHQLVWHVAQRLSGLAFAEDTFTVDGRTGAEHAAEGYGRALGWVRRKLSSGFSEFDSNAYMAIDTLALTCLVEHEPDPELRDAAQALLDLLLLALCCNAFRGVHGAAHGRSYVPTLRSARTEETSPILRLIAGVGTLNTALLPVAALATSRAYGIPDICRRIAAAPAQEWWGRQTFRGRYAFERDLLSRPYGSDLRVFRTRSTCLSSVQDYRAGLPGLQEHVGGASLGTELQVFITLPANEDTGASARPNAWAGQRVLPRVRQHRNVMITLYDAPTQVAGRLVKPHLWLPEAQCDNVVRDGVWLAGRRGGGVVAVATPGGTRPMLSGEAAYQEHQPVGDGTAWLTVTAEGVEDLQAWLAGLAAPDFTSGCVWQTPDGETVALSERGPFLVDGRAADLTDDGLLPEPPRLDNPAVTSHFGDAELEASWEGAELVLDLEAGRRVRAHTHMHPNVEGAVP